MNILAVSAVGDLGIDAVINYRNMPDLAAALGEAAPDGIDIYFDNVGGGHLEAAIANANKFARFPLCGSTTARPRGRVTSMR